MKELINVITMISFILAMICLSFIPRNSNARAYIDELSYKQAEISGQLIK